MRIRACVLVARNDTPVRTPPPARCKEQGGRNDGEDQVNTDRIGRRGVDACGSRGTCGHLGNRPREQSEVHGAGGAARRRPASGNVLVRRRERAGARRRRGPAPRGDGRRRRRSRWIAIRAISTTPTWSGGEPRLARRRRTKRLRLPRGMRSTTLPVTSSSTANLELLGPGSVAGRYSHTLPTPGERPWGLGVSGDAQAPAFSCCS